MIIFSPDRVLFDFVEGAGRHFGTEVLHFGSTLFDFWGGLCSIVLTARNVAPNTNFSVGSRSTCAVLLDSGALAQWC